jgi:lysyl-tRNA synthetase class 2
MPSTVIRSFAYEAAARRLTVIFRSGRRYTYLEVPAEIYRELRGAFSKGEYFNEHIRDQFAFERNESGEPLGGATGTSH